MQIGDQTHLSTGNPVRRLHREAQSWLQVVPSEAVVMPVGGMVTNNAASTHPVCYDATCDKVLTLELGWPMVTLFVQARLLSKSQKNKYTKGYQNESH